MSSDLRVALRIQAEAGNSRREVNSLERDLRQAGKQGAKALADESNKAGAALNRTAQAGTASYKIIRQVMRESATQGSAVFRQDLQLTQAEFKKLESPAARLPETPSRSCRRRTAMASRR